MNRAERRKILKTNGQDPAADLRAETAVALRDQAISRHRAGQLAEAAALFERSLALNNDDSLTHHGLGLALRDRGDPEAALRHLHVAAALTSEDPVILNNIGSIHFAAARFAEARQAFEVALTMRRDWPLLWRNLGASLIGLDLPEQAVAALSRAVKMAPNDPWAHYHMGRAAMKLGEATTAIAAFEEALTLDQNNHALAIALGELCDDIGDFARADTAYRHALMLRSDDVATILRVARRLTHAGKADEALILLNHAREIAPNEPGCAIGLAWARRNLGDPEAAESLCHEVLASHPELTEARFLLGFLRMEAGDAETARACFDTVMTMDPAHLDAGSNDAYLSLAAGDLATGWQKFEHRLRLPAFRYYHHVGRRWTGEPLDGLTILIEAEQGFGDTLQFVRYVPLVAAQAAQVLLRVPPMLTGLLGGFPANVTLVPWESRTNGFDVRIELMSLPLMFGTTLETIPAAIPYLSVDSARIAAWADRFAAEAGDLKIGIVWAGNPDHQNDCNRSMPIAALAPLTGLAGVRLYSLQVGARAADLDLLPAGSITDLSPQLTDFAETAAALSALDLVIAVDTSVVHLAGALGRPAWLLLSTVSEWRWLKDRDDTPWYPTVRLFRQDRYRDWAGLVSRVAEALATLRAGGGQPS